VPFTKIFNPGEILTASDVNEHLLNGGYQFRETVYFTSSGTFVKADYPWLRAIRVKCQGGGGGGAGGLGDVNVAPGGGGGGGYAESFITNISGLASSVTVTRGAGGSGGPGGGASVNAGSTGGTSSFGALVSATGGAGGGNSSGSGGEGTGDLAVTGSSGSVNSFTSSPFMSGDGGGSFFGGSVRGKVDAGDGLSGRQYGGGGSGSSIRTPTGRAGGAGANGIVIVELYA
jgi:hypothetical protein